MSRIIILSGPLGAGKSTVAVELLRLFDTRVAYVEGDVFWQFFSKGAHFDLKERRELVRPLMRSMMGASAQLARSGVDVLLDFTIWPDFLTTARKIAKEVTLDFVLLCPSEEVCAKRALERAACPVEDYSVYSDFYAMFAESGRPMVADDSGDAASVAKQIHGRLAEGEFRISDEPAGKY